MTIDRSSEVAAAIRRYLEANPGAVDTAGGIRQWWLPGSGLESEATVAQALRNLVNDGVIEELKRSDGAIVYRRRRAA